MGFRQFFLLSVLIAFSIYHGAQAQNTTDSTSVILLGQDSLAKTDDASEVVIDTLENRPNTAALYSAALPGLGQAYNKKYWKIPIIYAGGLVLGYFINYNHRLYVQYRNGLIALIDGDERTQPFDPRLDKGDYERAIDYWRRNRDLVIIGAIFVYILNIVDAHVDAHLELFRIEEDIGLNVSPSIRTTAMNTNIVGLSLTLNLNR